MYPRRPGIDGFHRGNLDVLASQGGSFVVITGGLSQLDGLSISDTAKARIIQAVDAGKAVCNPSRMVVIGGQTTVDGWKPIGRRAIPSASWKMEDTKR